MMQNMRTGNTGQHVRLQFDVDGCNREQKELLRHLKASTVLGKRHLARPGGARVISGRSHHSIRQGQRLRQRFSVDR